MIHLFLKLTSQKTEIREQPTHNINSTVLNKPCWFKWISGNYFRLLRLQKNYEHINALKFVMENAPSGIKSVVYNHDGISAKYTFAKWAPLTAKENIPINIAGNRIMRSPDKKIGLADICRESGRIKSFQISDAILLSYYKDIRFVIFISILFGFTIWGVIAPEPLLLKPLALSSPNIKFIIDVLKDTYVNHVCSTHHDVSSPCECGEPLNKTARDLFPLNSFDPLKIDNKQSGKIINVSLMVATIILSIALTESVSEYGVYLKI